MSYATYCRFIFSLISSIFILNINISFAGIPNYLCFSLSKEAIEKGYKLVGVNQPWKGLWEMPLNNSFEIMDKTGKNSLFIKTTGKYQSYCTEYRDVTDRNDWHYECIQSKEAWTAHIVATQARRGDGLSVQGCGAASAPFRYLHDLPCCQLSVNDRE